MSFTFRDYSSSILLMIFALSTTAVFSGAILSQSNAQLIGQNNDTPEKLNENLKTIQPDTSELKQDAGGASPSSSLGFVGVVFKTVKNVLAGIGLLPTLAGVLISDLNFTEHIVLLAAIPAVAVIWEAISVYQAYRT